MPTFQEFASEWLENREPELRPKTIASYRWQLTTHLLPHFARMRLDQIGPEDVDRYKTARLREGAATMAGAGLARPADSTGPTSIRPAER